MRDIDLFNDLGRNRKLPQIAMMDADSAGTGFYLCLRKDVRTSRAGDERDRQDEAEPDLSPAAGRHQSRCRTGKALRH